MQSGLPLRWNRPTTVLGWCRHDLANAWWAFVVVPPLLTMAMTLLVDPPLLDRTTILTRFGFNTAATLCIGGSAIVCNGVVRTLWERRFGTGHPARYFVYYPAVIGIALLLGVELLMSRGLVFGYPVEQFRGLVFVTGLVVLAIVAAIVTAQSKLKRYLVKEALRSQAAEGEARDAELRALQAHLNPHFLFNALNTLADLVEEKPRRAVDAIERLGGLLRYSMPQEHEVLVPLERELGAIEDYLELQSLRFESRLRARIDVEPELLGVPVPRLLLQPLIENAVTHAVATTPDGADVELRAHVRGRHAHFRVEDSGGGVASTRGCGSALENLERRLELHYEGNATLDIQPRGHGFVVELLIPLEVSA